MSPEHEKAHRALHKLWTAAVGTPGYDKRAWHALEEAMTNAIQAERRRHVAHVALAGHLREWMSRQEEARATDLRDFNVYMDHLEGRDPGVPSPSKETP